MIFEETLTSVHTKGSFFNYVRLSRAGGNISTYFGEAGGSEFDISGSLKNLKP